jgi:hypothetical protein
MELESDLQNATDLFGGVAVTPGASIVFVIVFVTSIYDYTGLILF